MADESRSIVTFKSDAFNTTEPKDYFINPCCFGDDLGRWFIEELRARGTTTDDEPDQEDFGWYLDFTPEAGACTLVFSYRPGDAGEEGDWVAWLERSAGFFASLLGARKRGVPPEAARLIHSILTGSEKVRDVRWHRRSDFDSGREDLGVLEP